MQPIIWLMLANKLNVAKIFDNEINLQQRQPSSNNLMYLATLHLHNCGLQSEVTKKTMNL